MALAISFIAGGSKVASPANEAMGKITVYDGKFGWDPSLVWPQYMLMSNWCAPSDARLSRETIETDSALCVTRIPATMILIWVEFSHVMQWFISWSLFVWIGKVSYGFYLMQFLTIYGLMPHIALHFVDQGKTQYWSIVTPTYILCLMFNFFVAWSVVSLVCSPSGR